MGQGPHERGGEGPARLLLVSSRERLPFIQQLRGGRRGVTLPCRLAKDRQSIGRVRRQPPRGNRRCRAPRWPTFASDLVFSRRPALGIGDALILREQNHRPSTDSIPSPSEHPVPGRPIRVRALRSTQRLHTRVFYDCRPGLENNRTSRSAGQRVLASSRRASRLDDGNDREAARVQRLAAAQLQTDSLPHRHCDPRHQGFAILHVQSWKRRLLDTTIRGADHLSKGVTSATWHGLLVDQWIGGTSAQGEPRPRQGRSCPDDPDRSLTRRAVQAPRSARPPVRSAARAWVVRSTRGSPGPPRGYRRSDSGREEPPDLRRFSRTLPGLC